MKDFIIVGLGLSGACLTYRLEKTGKSFVVIDDKSQQASRVAGGLINPVNLKRFTLAWKANEHLKKAIEFYQDLERTLGKQFLSPLEVYRRFSSIEEQNDWFAAADKPSLAPFLDTQLVSNVNDHISGRYSFGRVLKTSRIDLKCLLESYRMHLQEKGVLENASFQYDDLEVSEKGVSYRGIHAKNIIFCEGFGLLKNTHFSYLPLKGNKGEYIIIKAPGLDLKVAVKSSVFIFPTGNDHYMVGATYNHSDKTFSPTEEAREELINKVRHFLNFDFEVVDQVAGIRPTTNDRRPLIGQHPQYKNLYTCNGFGSRGIIMAPSLSEELLTFINQDKAIDPEIDISRFTKKWYEGI